MKYALMSDAHSNPEALRIALADAKKRKCEKYVFLGDVTGYGYDVKTTLGLVKENFDVVVMGNHDAVCSGLEHDESVMLNEHYDIDRAQGREIDREDVNWLRKLKLGYRNKDFVGVHSDFVDPQGWGYIIDSEEAYFNFSETDDRVMFCGHSHHAAVWELNGKNELREKFTERFGKLVTAAESISFSLAPSSRYIINIGSVGYPRNDFCSTYAIFDSESQRVTIRRLPFDFKGYIMSMLSAKVELPYWLKDILMRAVKKYSK